jgi:hypothetical protein
MSGDAHVRFCESLGVKLPRATRPYFSASLAGDCRQRFQGKAAFGDTEYVKGVRTGRHLLFGPYLEVQSRTSAPQFFRSEHVRFRFYMRRPEDAYKSIRHGGLS